MIFSEVRSSSVVFLEELNKNDPPFYSHHAREPNGEITPVHFQMIDASPHLQYKPDVPNSAAIWHLPYLTPPICSVPIYSKKSQIVGILSGTME
jgi:hypothetical protein